jgi:hypothetical protein
MSSCTCTTTGGGRGWKAQSSKSRKRGASKLSKLMSSSSNHTRLRGEWREGGREGGRESAVCVRRREMESDEAEIPEGRASLRGLCNCGNEISVQQSFI